MQLIYEKSIIGRRGVRLPASDVPAAAPLPEGLLRKDAAELPEISELDAVRHFTNLSVTQFYNVDVDNASPIYNIYGGTQDNNTLGGPSRNTSEHGIVNSDWFVTVGGDGAIYFTVGGRGGQSELYRVVYTGSESTVAVDARSSAGAAERVAGVRGREVGIAATPRDDE